MQLSAISFDFIQAFFLIPLPLQSRRCKKCKQHPTDCNRANKEWTCIRSRQPQPQTTDNMTEELKQVADLVTANTIFTTKEVLTSDEAAAYMGISKSYLYKLTMRQQIPFFRPMGKMCYFNRKELETWLQQNRCATADEISQQAQAYCIKTRRA